jgi:predicted nucleotidyltransferase
MTLQELRDRRREEILRVAAHRNARNVRVFGSVARGDNDEKSDVDILVEMEPGSALFDLSGCYSILSRCRTYLWMSLPSAAFVPAFESGCRQRLEVSRSFGR